MQGSAKKSCLAILAVIISAVSFQLLASPSAGYTPEQVVRLQLEALSNNDEPVSDAGIAIVWAFASPQNRESTGPLDRFVEMVHGGYAPMLNHQRHRLLESEMVDGQFVQLIELKTAVGDWQRYIFRLSEQQTQNCDGCWLTDAVVPLGPPEKSEYEFSI